MNKIQILQKLKHLDGLKPDERAYLINLVNTNKKYGLLWEDKIEEVEKQLREKLPVLKEVEEKAIINSPEDPNHIIIEGDNLHALTALTFTHEGAIDIIYIDPPYNTGNKDFKYNDSYVDKEDSFKHSKWLSFIHKRLQIAKRLLNEKGVIFMSIDDNEHPQLKLLCDEVFGQKNFISNIIWAAGKKNDSKHVSNSHEYIICYFKNIDVIKENKIVWRERKEGIDNIYKTVDALVKKHKGNFETATLDLKKWFKDLPNSHPAKAHSHYSIIDSKGVFFPDNISWPGGGGPQFEVLHPVTKKPVITPSRGWVYSSPKRMQEIIDEGKVYFGKDENSVPTLKSYLKDREFQVPYSVIYQDGRAATKRLMDMFGYAPFDNPKDENIISRLIQFSSNKDSKILDFFAGSGTTLHATMQLNVADGGNRQCILVTNNENNICEEVTYERNKRVIQGYTNAKGIQVEGLINNNLRYYKSDFVPSTKTEINKRLLTKAGTELLQIKENCYNNLTEANGFNSKQCAVFSDNYGKYMIVVYHSRKQQEVCEQLVDYIKTLDTAHPVKLYAFSPEKETLVSDFEEVADKIEAVPLPDAIYNAYKATLRTLKLERKLMSLAEITELENAPELFNPIAEE